jgi:hypothetical protein
VNVFLLLFQTISLARDDIGHVLYVERSHQRNKTRLYIWEYILEKSRTFVNGVKRSSVNSSIYSRTWQRSIFNLAYEYIMRFCKKKSSWENMLTGAVTSNVLYGTVWKTDFIECIYGLKIPNVFFGMGMSLNILFILKLFWFTCT